MNNTIRNPEYLAKVLTPPALPNFLEKLNPTQRTAPQITEDPALICIEKLINCARKHPKATITVGAVTILLGLYFLQEDSKHT